MNKQPALTTEAGTGCRRFDGDSQKLPESHRQNKAQFIEYERSRKISDMLSEEQFYALSLHLHNGNEPQEFSMAISHEDGSWDYYTAKRQRFPVAVRSTWQSIVDQSDYPFASTVKAKNPAQTSHWAAFDVDAHDEAFRPHAEWLLRKILGVIRKFDEDALAFAPCALIEDSFRGFHIWLISPKPHNIRKWRQLISNILFQAGVDSGDGVETFPSSSERGLGSGLRLPGSANLNSWHPGRGSYSCSKIIADRGLTGLVESLPAPDWSSFAEEVVNKRGVLFVNKKEPSKPKKLNDHKDAKRILERYAIRTPSSRHNQLCGLVGDGFFHFSRAQLRSLANYQYGDADPRPMSKLEEHLAEFDEAYAGWEKQIDARMSKEELACLGSLRGKNIRSAFIIAQNFARLAKTSRKWGPDGRFPLSGLDLACRLGSHTNTGYSARSKLIEAGAIRIAEESKGTHQAARFVWLLPMK